MDANYKYDDIGQHLTGTHINDHLSSHTLRDETHNGRENFHLL